MTFFHKNSKSIKEGDCNMQSAVVPKKVIFSERAYAAVLAETKEMITTETGGVFLGIAERDVYYIVETIDPGPNSIFQTTYFEYDKKYISHLANKINKLYSDKLDVLGLWHRHPGGLDSFSHTDDDTNKRFARENDGCTISAIVNVDPKFRLTIYLATLNPLEYNKIPYEVSDNTIPREIRSTTPYKDIEYAINTYASHNSTPMQQQYVVQRTVQQPNYANEREHESAINQGQRSTPPSFELVNYRSSRSHTPTQQQTPPPRQNAMSIESINDTLKAIGQKMNKLTPLKCSHIRVRSTDENFDRIVGKLYDVIELCEKKGMPVTIEKGNDSLVNLVFGKYTSSLRFVFFSYNFANNPATINNGFWAGKTIIEDERICFQYKDKIYLYVDDFFKSIIN